MCCGCYVPDMVTEEKDMLKDSGTTGGTVISEEIDFDFKDATWQILVVQRVLKTQNTGYR